VTDGARPYGGSPPHGSLGEEASRLAEAVQDWLGERAGRGARDVWALATAGPQHYESPECRICPLCRAMHLFTSVRPEVLDHLAEAAAAIGAALRAMGEPEQGPDENPTPATVPDAGDGEA
jgi:hypothetical protein